MNKIQLLIISCLIISVQSASYRYEKIKQAQVISRPLYIPIIPNSINSKLNNIGINHQAVKITTENNKNYIISNNPKNGIHITDAKISNKWTVDKEIKVSGEKYIGEVMNEANGFGNGLTSYITSKTCIGTTNAVEKSLKK